MSTRILLPLVSVAALSLAGCSNPTEPTFRHKIKPNRYEASGDACRDTTKGTINNVRRGEDGETYCEIEPY